MIALYITGGILLLLIILLIIPVGIRIKYDKDFSMFVTAGLIKVRILPGKEKKIKISDYSEKKLRRQREKQKRRQEKKARKKKRKEPEEKKEKKDSVLAARLKNIDTAPDMIAELYDMLMIVSDKFAKRLTVKVFRLDAIIGSDNAAKTAILFGGATSLASCFSAFLDQHMTLKKRRGASINVAPDFLAEKPLLSADVQMTVTLGGMFTFLFEIRSVIREILKLIQEDNSNG
jgi:hypothetical protein